MFCSELEGRTHNQRDRPGGAGRRPRLVRRSRWVGRAADRPMKRPLAPVWKPVGERWELRYPLRGQVASCSSWRDSHVGGVSRAEHPARPVRPIGSESTGLDNERARSPLGESPLDTAVRW